jgi:Icc-related predicted phosphoesterase
MRVLAFADLHDEEAALDSLRRLAPSYDLVFACGDISQSVSFAESVVASLPRSLIVPGNWDSGPVDGFLSSSPGWLHGRSRPIGEGLEAAGFGFSSPTPFGTHGELSEEEIWEGISRLPAGPGTLLLLHCPPMGHFDRVRGGHAGSASILRFIEERQPLAALCGHIHESKGVSMIGRTTLVKLPPAEGMQACALSITNKKITAEFISL